MLFHSTRLELYVRMFENPPILPKHIFEYQDKSPTKIAVFHRLDNKLDKGGFAA